MEKQLILSRLPLCKDVQELIKSFLFYDNVQSDARYYKQHLHTMLSNSFYSNDKFWINEPPPDLWFFMHEEICMTKRFCLNCGNYKLLWYFDSMSCNYIVCRCVY
jgi:hypothetical protein